MTRVTGLPSVFSAALLIGPAAWTAHHGDAGRYENTLTTVTGTVLEVQLVNPHSVLMLEVVGNDGAAVIWRGELGPPRMLRGWCWDDALIRTGDRITMRGRRLKNGQPYMTLSEEARVLDADGRELFRGNEPGQDNEPGPCAD